MTQSVITHVSQKLRIDGIKDVEVTDIVEDGAGGWIRSIRFYGTPAEGVNGILVLEVLLQSPVKAELAITTPEIDF
jgi:hypothetical protein